MPGGGKRTGFGLAVSYGDGNDEVGINPAGKRKLPEELEQTSFVASLVGIDLGIVAFKVTVGQRGRRAVTRARDVHHIQVIFLDQTVQVNPNQRLSRIRPPMTKEPMLDVLRPQGLAKQRIRA